MAQVRVIDPVLSQEFQRFSQALDRYLREMEGEMGVLVKKQARLFAFDLMSKTNPFGLNKKAREMGEKAIYRDVHKVFATVGRVYREIEKDSKQAANAFYFAARSGDVQDARDIMQRTSKIFKNTDIGEVDPSIHQKRRGTEGRVTGQRPSVVVNDSAGLIKYRDDVALRVAWAKASFAVEVWRLGGGRGVPAWIARHKNAPGSIIDLTQGNSPKKQVEFISNVPYIKNLLSFSSVRRAIGQRASNMIKEMERIAIAKAKRNL